MIPARQPNQHENSDMICASFHRISVVQPENCYNCVHRHGYPQYLFGDENCDSFVEICAHTSPPAPETNERAKTIIEAMARISDEMSTHSDDDDIWEGLNQARDIIYNLRCVTPAQTGMLPCPDLVEVETEPGLKEWVCQSVTAKAERERLLRDIEKWCSDEGLVELDTNKGKHFVVYVQDLEWKLLSLRTQQEQQQSTHGKEG